MLAKRKDTRLEESSCAITPTSSEEKRCFIAAILNAISGYEDVDVVDSKSSIMRHLVQFCRSHRLASPSLLQPHLFRCCILRGALSPLWLKQGTVVLRSDQALKAAPFGAKSHVEYTQAETQAGG